MTLVIDTSVTMAWCFEDEARPETDAVLARLNREESYVPALWALEVSNVLLVAERRGRITESQTARFLTLVGRLPLHVDDAAVDMGAIAAIGRGHGLSAYDACYLALAQRLGAELATADQKLRGAARSAGVPLAF